MDCINLSSIFNDYKIQQLIPPYFDNLETPLICYKYKNSIRNMIFNYSNVTKDIDVQENIPNTCKCNESKFRYDPCGHIITGDLNILKDKEVINLLRKGPKYRIPSKIDWKECRKVIMDALTSYCKSWIKREKADGKSLDDFQNNFMNIVDCRIQHFESNFKQKPRKNISRIESKLKDLGMQYVFVPADKAANNVVIV